MISVSRVNTSQSDTGPIRPVNLRTDLAPLADLIELVFADSMDSSGRAALREMRYLSKMGPGLRLISRVNDLATGISMGYVWIEDKKLIGNVSVYPANWPQVMGKAYIIANVGTHPDYQNRGIARRLMQSSMHMIAEKGADCGLLQVDIGNDPARHLYRKLGFAEERAFTTWRRSGFVRNTPPTDKSIYMRRRRRSEWRAELELCQRTRPQQHGGVGWLRPLHPGTFRQSLWSRIGNWLSLRGTEYMVAQHDDDDTLAASMWIENTLAGRTRLTVISRPEADVRYVEALVNNAVNRYNRTALTIEHPADDIRVNNVLRRYQFTPQRTVMHMRWDAQSG